jgi:PAS domain S-box-containing protein
MIIIGFITYWVTDEVNKSNIEREEVYKQLVEISKLRNTLRYCQQDFNNYIKSDNQNNFSVIYKYRDTVNIHFTRLQNLLSGSKFLNSFYEFKTKVNNRFVYMEQMARLKQSRMNDSLLAYVFNYTRSPGEVNTALYAFEDMEHQRIKQLNGIVQSRQNKTTKAIFLGTVTTCIFFLMIFYLLDKEITERKRMEEEVRQEMMFRDRLLNSSIDGIISFDKDCNITLWNPGMSSMTGLTKSSVIGQNAFQVLPVFKEIGEDKYFYETLRGNYIIAKDRWIQFSDSEKKLYYEAYYSPVFDSAKQVIGGLVIIRNTTQRKLSSEALAKAKEDLEYRVLERTAELSRINEELKKEIAQRKLAEEQINHSLQEKVVLLQEIHHRVKNNLQVISSLLNLQSNYINDEESLEIFRESQNRVKSMALIHEKLYQSNDIHRIEFDEYIRSLCKDLFISYNTDSSRIALVSELSTVYFEIDTAILCGLIINELISNSLKHAFPGDRRGQIYISLSQAGNECLLIIRDNGKGFPGNLDFRNTESLGLQIVNTLTDQLGGNIELNRDEFTEFRITFMAGKVTRARSKV